METDEDLLQPARPTTPEENLLIAVMLRADDDCSTWGADEAIPAYRWIVERAGAFDTYCHALGLDPGIVRDHLVRKHMGRVEPMLRRQAALADLERARIAASA